MARDFAADLDDIITRHKKRGVSLEQMIADLECAKDDLEEEERDA